VNGSRHGAEGTHFYSTFKRRMEMTKKANLKLVYRGVRHNGETIKSKQQTKGVYRGSKWVA